MGLVEYAARELCRELHKGSQEFYEFVMPAIDMYEDGNDLVVQIDMPGFAKEEINLRIIDGNILSIKAKRKAQERLGPVHYIHRPVQIDKRVIIPISTKEGEKVVGTAKYANGVVTLRVPIPRVTVVQIT
jgi:HSP20 family molecular chaperone IbpA